MERKLGISLSCGDRVLDSGGLPRSKGMKEQFALVMGELALHIKNLDEVRTKSPEAGEKIKSIVDLMNSIAL